MKYDLLLAPMMDVTTPPYILLCKHYGGVGTYTIPMIFANQIKMAPKTIVPLAEFAEKYRPSGIQIAASGRSAEDIKAAVEILNGYSFDLVDINAGCPARHTTGSGGGASLLKPHRFNDLMTFLNTVLKYSDKPVSIKIRTGWDNTDNLDNIVRAINDAGPEFLTVHGRFAKQGYSGIADITLIKRVKELSDIPVVGNGDVFDFGTYFAMKTFAGVDAVMIGRASMGYPRVFADIANHPDYGKVENLNYPPEDLTPDGIPYQYTESYREKNIKICSVEEIREFLGLLLEFIEKLGPYWNKEKYKLIELRRNAIWAVKGHYNSARVRAKIGQARDLNLLKEYIFGDGLEKDLSPRHISDK